MIFVRLSGGIFTDEVTEIVGPSSSGKTQICLSTAVTLTKDGKATVAYIDSSMSLSPDRIHVRPKEFAIDPNSFPSNTSIARVCVDRLA